MKRYLTILLMLICTLGTYSQTSAKNIAISRAKELMIATANGNVATIKRLTTPEFYKDKYPYSDATVRSMLLNVPYEKRQKMIDQVKNHCKATAIMNRAGDIITVSLANQITGKEFTIQLMDESGNGNWLVFEYYY